MAVGSNIVLADAQGSPVNHTFVWDGESQDGLSNWEDRSSGLPIGYWTIRLSLVKPKKRAQVDGKPSASGNYRVRVVLERPTMEVVSNSTVSGIEPAPTVAYKTVADMTFVLPERSSALARADIAKMAANLLSHTQIANAIKDLDKPR